MGILALAVASAVLVPFNAESVDNVCGWSIDSVADLSLDDKTGYELYVGRMETRMNELGVSEEDKPEFRTACDIYVHGGARALAIILREVKKNERKRASRSK